MGLWSFSSVWLFFCSCVSSGGVLCKLWSAITEHRKTPGWGRQPSHSLQVFQTQPNIYSGIKSCVIIHITRKYVWTFLFVCEIAVLQLTVNELLKATHLIRERCYAIFIQEACFIFYIWLQKHVLTCLRSFSSTNLFSFQKRHWN